jgi:hypothetical protein
VELAIICLIEPIWVETERESLELGLDIWFYWGGNVLWKVAVTLSCSQIGFRGIGFGWAAVITGCSTAGTIRI